MQTSASRRSSLFLMELIIAILFFSIAAAVCVQFFVKSHTLEQQSVDLNHAVNATSSVAEVLRNSDTPFAILEEQYPFCDHSGQACAIFFDENWVACKAEQAIFTLTVEMDWENNFVNSIITVTNNETSIYSLEIKKFQEGEVRNCDH